MKKFDLNIEEVLEDWEVYHALREIISNALDEQILSKTKDMEKETSSKTKENKELTKKQEEAKDNKTK